jgi:acetyl esterase
VVSVHYRRTPEHPLPAAQQDAVSATCWALAHAAELGADPARLVVAGDSAGGGLAAHVAQYLRDHGPSPAALQVLIYPATDFSLDQADRDPALARLLDWAAIDWFSTHSMPPGLDRRDPAISPLHAADLAGLPPAFVVTAEVDPFRSDAVAYCAALRLAACRSCAATSPGRSTGSPEWTSSSRPAGPRCGRSPRPSGPPRRYPGTEPVSQQTRNRSAGLEAPPTAGGRSTTLPSGFPWSTART